MSLILSPAFKALQTGRAQLRRTDEPKPAATPQTLRPFICVGSYVRRVTVDGSTFPRFVPFTRIVEAEHAGQICAPDVAPADAQSVTLCASSAEDLERSPLGLREHMKHAMSALLMWRKAKALGKKPEQMEPWADYDPIAIDAEVDRWAAGRGVRFAGD